MLRQIHAGQPEGVRSCSGRAGLGQLWAARRRKLPVPSSGYGARSHAVRGATRLRRTPPLPSPWAANNPHALPAAERRGSSTMRAGGGRRDMGIFSSPGTAGSSWHTATGFWARQRRFSLTCRGCSWRADTRDLPHFTRGVTPPQAEPEAVVCAGGKTARRALAVPDARACSGADRRHLQLRGRPGLQPHHGVPG